MLGSLILYLKGTRIMMFQLSGFYCKPSAGFRSQSLEFNHGDCDVAVCNCRTLLSAQLVL